MTINIERDADGYIVIKPNARTTIRGGHKLVSVAVIGHGIKANSIIIGTDDLTDLINGLVEMREKLDPRPPTKPEDAWRDVCADMIRVGEDSEAVAVFVEKAPFAVPYIKALEGVLKEVSKLNWDQAGPSPTPYALIQAYNHAVCVGSGAFEPKICVDCQRDPDPRGWSACSACRRLNG